MSQVAIVTDTTACLPKSLVQEHGIRLVPMELLLQGKTYRDGIDITPNDFYVLMARSRDIPTTSPPSPGTYLEAFQELSQRSEAILCITVSRRFSGMFDCASAAKEIAKEILPHTPIEVIDCGTAAGAQGLIVLAAARAAATGASLEQTITTVHSLMPRVHLFAFLDTLHYLARGGRVPTATAWAASLLKIKPIVQVKPVTGEASLMERARTRQRAMVRLVEIVEALAKNGPLHAIVMHANAPEDAERLRRQVTAVSHLVESYVEPFTPVMGAHAGPGLLGIAFYTDLTWIP